VTYQQLEYRTRTTNFETGKLCGNKSVALGLIKINTNQTITMTKSDVSMHDKK